MEVENCDLLQELCTQNGIFTNDANSEIDDVKILYALFSGLWDLPCLSNFGNLTEIVIISQSLKKISNLDSCPQLRSLWICECELKTIENLSCCRFLEKLYLYGNAIEKIENLSELQNLSTLWLNENRINSIEGISNLSNLKTLNLSDNFIRTLGKEITDTNLSVLAISGNYLSDVQEIEFLTRLHSLRSLSINECGFRRNPICYNVNLPLILIYHLPKLQFLDNVNLEIPELRHAIRAVMHAKQGFYAMRAQNVHSIHDTRLLMLKELYKSIETRILAQIQQLDRTMKSLHFYRSFNTKTEHKIEAVESVFINQCISELKTRITFWEYMIEKYNEEFSFAADVLNAHTTLKLSLLQLELELCGYFEFTEATTNDEWFHRCSKLLVSRFCLHHPNATCITGIRIHNVYKVINKLVQNKFDACKQKHLQSENCFTTVNEEYIPDINNLETEQEYLLIVCPKTHEKLNFFSEVLRSGIKLPLKGIKLTNSLNLADNDNLAELFKCYSESKQWTSSRFTTVLVIRVYRAFGVESSDFINDTTNSNSLITDTCTENNCSCLLVNKSYIFSDEHCLLPEFLVEIEYITKHEITSPFYQVLVNKSGQIETTNLEEDMRTDLTIIKKIPHRLVCSLTSDTSEGITDSFIERNIVHLSESKMLIVNDVKCPRSLNLETFSGLTHLRLTHCHLQKIPSINGNKLRLIDVSHNKINSIKNMPVLNELVCFDISYNALNNLTEDVQTFQKTCPNLRELHLRFNPWKGQLNPRSITAAMIPNIVILDNKEITEYERIQGKQLIAYSKVCISFLVNHSSSTAVSMKEYTYLTIGSVAEYVVHQSRIMLPIDNTISWNNITAVSLPRCNLQNVESLERISNLRYLCLDFNQLTTLENISQCMNLEELSVEHNLICHIDELGCLKKLRRLFVGNNFIKSLADIRDGSFTSLHVVTLRSNNISRLNGLNVCKGLREIYLGNNNISELKSVLILKAMPHLSVIDFHGNSITHKLEHYRLRIIYYLKGIKSLDGYEVRPSEVIQSKELLSGHLSQEFLMEKLETNQFFCLKQLDMPNLGLKIVDYLSPENFSRLQSVNLEKNQLTSFGGLLLLSQLRVLCLNENCIESLFPRNIYSMAESVYDKSTDSIDLQYLALYRSKQAIFPYLQVVHLAKNQITSLEAFHFHRMPALRSLFLQHNEISNISGLEGLHQLRELVLDGNRIKEIGEVSFFYNWSLQEIHLENNRLKELHSLSGIESLKRLYVGGNKLCDLTDLESFAVAQKNLVEISLIDNPITAKQLHRLILVHGLPRLQSIDGNPVTLEEKERANAFYADQELQHLLTGNNLPGNNSQLIKSSVGYADIALPGINLQKTALLTSKSTFGNHGSNMSIFQNRPSYAIVTIGSHLEESDSALSFNKTQKQGNYQPKNLTLRTDSSHVINETNHFTTPKGPSDSCNQTHVNTISNIPGMSVKGATTAVDVSKSFTVDLSKTTTMERMWQFSATYGTNR